MAKGFTARFVMGAPRLDVLPATALPEAAVAGRSNVGKSSLINRLTGEKNLARTSATPGRTQEINFFHISGGAGDWHLVDLPGFGFAKLSGAQREDIQALLGGYISEREQLRVVCLLNDCRRDPEEEELSLRNLAFESGKSVLVIGTKADKLKRNELASRRAKLARAYNLEASDVLLTGEGDDGREIMKRILTLF